MGSSGKLLSDPFLPLTFNRKIGSLCVGPSNTRYNTRLQLGHYMHHNPFESVLENSPK